MPPPKVQTTKARTFSARGGDESAGSSSSSTFKRSRTKASSLSSSVVVVESTVLPNDDDDDDDDINKHESKDITLKSQEEEESEEAEDREEERDSGGLASTLPPISDAELAQLQVKTPGGTLRYSSSIYTDAFAIALDTVLADESHLFDDDERTIFAVYKALPYDAQYLYVRLFLRKTAAWFRVSALKYDSDIQDMPATVARLCALTPPFAERADATTIDSLADAVALLTLDELKTLAKNDKLTGTTKPQLTASLLRSAAAQGRITAGGPLALARDPNTGKPLTRRAHYLARIFALTGPCVRLCAPPRALFDRVHLVFYRSAAYTERALTALVLARAARRHYVPYLVSRSAAVFASRDVLLEFERALHLQARVDELLESHGAGAGGAERLLREVVAIAEGVHTRWVELVATSTTDDDWSAPEHAYLRRFSPAWVLTRIVHKGAHALGRLKQHTQEHLWLTELLAQRSFHTARRGAWYTRKALIEEHYLFPASDRNNPNNNNNNKRAGAAAALATACAGLQDPLTHLVHHHELQTRIARLERVLRVPRREQHDFSYAQLRRASSRTIFATRIHPPPPPPSPLSLSSSSSSTSFLPPPPPTTTKGSKTLWQNPITSSSSSPISVEETALTHYRTHLSYRGVHTESRLPRTLFALLFFDILFPPPSSHVPNVFQTAYQTAPLDLGTEGFLPARARAIAARLSEISSGEAARIVAEVWKREEGKRTCVVGLDWGWDVNDLVEICECFPPGGLAVVMRVLCEGYWVRAGGMPDLFLWRRRRRGGDDDDDDDDENDRGEVMFVEVKSENDRVSEAQRLWMHVLSGAGVAVEVCHVLHSPSSSS